MYVLLRIVACGLSGFAAFVLGCACAMRASRISVNAGSLSLEEVLQDRWLCFILFAAVSGVACAAVTLRLLPLCLAFSLVLSKRAKGYLDKRRRQELCRQVDAQVDVLADVIALACDAGLSFDAAVDLYCQKFDGVLSQRLSAARMAMRGGVRTRREALEDIVAETGSTRFSRLATTSLQAIERGAPLGGMLNRFSQEIRRERRASMERQVEKAPVKMLVPTGLLILPAMLILVMGPALLQFVGQGV